MPTPFPKQIRSRRAAFSLVEVMVALGIFVVAGMGVIQVLGVINNSATVDRAMSAARLLVGAKIAKAQTDTWTPTNNTIPKGCTAPALPAPNNEAYKDQADNLDFGLPDPQDMAKSLPYFDLYGTPSNVTTYPVVIVNSGQSGSLPVITGTMTQTVAPFEAASKTVLITYTLSFSYRGKPYQFSQSIVRAPDQI